jgi:hypothetical protein
MTSTLIPIPEYLRMSTEHQQYSLENQTAAIQKYAQERNFQIAARIRTLRWRNPAVRLRTRPLLARHSTLFERHRSRYVEVRHMT